MKNSLLPFFFLLLITCLPAKAQQTISAVIPGDFADPSVISDGKFYYAVGTSSEWAPHFPIYRSGNLEQWEQVGYVFDKAPDWTIGSFWAPEYYFMNGRYYIYYTARRKKDHVSCIGVAVSDYPDRGFIDKGVLLDFGKEAIDAFIVEDKGHRYISFKAYGLDKRPIELLAKKLSADGLKTEGEVFSLLKDETGIGLEGQSFIQKDGYYYLFYSAGSCCGIHCDYNVRVARAKNFRGPYERYDKNPVLQENPTWKCSGHGTFIFDKKGAYYYLYHAYHKESSLYTGRQALLAKLSWPEPTGWPRFEQPVTSSAGATRAPLQDFFKGDKPGLYWQWDWRHSNPYIQQTKGELRLGGTVIPGNQTGIVLTVRPATADFSLYTKLAAKTTALQGLVYYGDAGAALGIGIIGNQVQVWKVAENKRSVLQTAQLQYEGICELKLVVDTNHTCRFYYKTGVDSWQELVVQQAVSADFLPQWDRSPRPGLHIWGASGAWAVFKEFRLE
ncbi:glycoside hydrolase family 43 protein [Flavihumibacter sp. CACIAM 22H1]|uniref:glycoside hydrolase family 43 protein n=1 Tax=Flavihumibacter sp. CACIAM 22H1 TaxID=1812911 RepID=UPI0007A89D5F|nr:glycoside hydrolase family 43 protein [Flavihumibacter sp. CACIAM 22H1]KYP13634.1 MAG: beta-xylosidase [Flavihumibacter sp. CACIAM 22H1]